MRISDWSSDVCSSDLFTVRVGDDFEREQVSALIMITVYPKQMPAVVEALRQMPEVRSLQSVSGIWDLAATGVVPTIGDLDALTDRIRSEEHTSELQSLMRSSYAVFGLKKKVNSNHTPRKLSAH